MRLRIGDVVIFKDWDEMAEEYGSFSPTCINTPRFGFINGMKHLCGTTAVVTYIEGYNKDGEVSDNAYIQLDDFTAEGRTSWNYCPAMVKLLKPAELPPKLKWEEVFLGGKT